jgi:hypothetical protein
MAYKNIKRGGVEYTVPMPGEVVEDTYGGEKYVVVEHRFDQNPDNYTSEPAKGQRPTKLVVREIVDDLYLKATAVEIPGDAVASRPAWRDAHEAAVMKAHKVVRYYALPFCQWHGPIDNAVSQDNMLAQAIAELREQVKELRREMDELQTRTAPDHSGDYA